MTKRPIVAKHGDFLIRKYTDRFGNAEYILFKNGLYIARHWDFNYLKSKMYEGENNEAH